MPGHPPAHFKTASGQDLLAVDNWTPQLMSRERAPPQMQSRHGYGYTADAGRADPRRRAVRMLQAAEHRSEEEAPTRTHHSSPWNRLAEIPRHVGC